MKILVIDDNPGIVKAIAIGFQLQWQEVEVITATNGEEGLEKFYLQRPDIILLDEMMPKRDGFSVLKEIRSSSDVPILMLTARGDEQDKVKGLELGADDYLTKPFSHPELSARIKAVLRRTQLPPPIPQAPSFVCGDLTINFANHQVTRAGQVVSLTPTEYNLLYLLARNVGRVVTTEMLLNRIWGEEYEDQTDYLKTYISRLRRKLEAQPQQPRLLLTVRGLGYRLVNLPGPEN